VLEDSFDGSKGKPVFHVNAVLAQISPEVQNPTPPGADERTLWTETFWIRAFVPVLEMFPAGGAARWAIIVHILEFCSIPFFRDSRKHIEI
jgi:hypothetical protein